MAESKHIVIDARNRRGPGAGRYSTRLLEHLQNLTTDHRFTVLLESGDTWKPRAANFKTAIAPYPQFSFNPLHDLRFASQLRKLRPDLVHFTMTQQPLTYRGKIVTTTHDLTMLRFIRAGKTPKAIFWLKRVGYRLIFYAGNKKSQSIIVPTKFVKEDLARELPFTADRSTVTYEASEPPLKAKAIRPNGVNKPFIFHVGSPFPHKNIPHLVESFEKLQEAHPDLQLVLAGKKEFYFNELEEWARDRSSYNSIVFTGFVSDEELKWLYENAECYVWPTLSEGFGLPGLEAMAHGCPLVSSNATCLPEVYGEAARYFDPYDIEDTTRAIEEVISDKSLRQKLIEAGHKQIQKYSWRKMAEQTLRVYNNTLDS